MRNTSNLILAEKSVPRYTSYPTAPHFSDKISGAAAKAWLSELPSKASLSLYLHIPFCSSICTYCGCNTKAIRREEPLDAYTQTLMREMELLSKSTKARRVTDIHWGGGTPSLLGPKRLITLHNKLRDCFDLSGEIEHAIELDPRTVDAELVAALAEIGITRASLGVQDFNPHVQEAIGRLQPFEVVANAVHLLRSVGIHAINLDLMYGLPYQTIEDVLNTAEQALTLNPSRLAIFGYAHVPWFKVHQRLIDLASLPGVAERLAQANAACDYFVKHGFQAIGLDHFARDHDPMAKAARAGTLRRNFQGYTTDTADALLPLGASSIGYMPQGYVQNAPDVAGWRRAVEAEELPIVKGIALDTEDRARADVIERLMCDFEVDFGAIAHAFMGDEAAFDDAVEELARLAKDGLLDLKGRTIRIHEDGRPFVRLAASAFDTYFKASAARHSMAV